MNDLSKKHYFLDSLGLFLVGIFSLGYVIFDRPFAELNVQLPFLDFPIFIGEILFLLCLCIFLYKGDLQFNKKYFWIIGYFGFVIIKALYGYLKFGPLAFRDAALFYYPAFIIFANSFYRREFFDAKKSIFFLVIIIFLLTCQGFNEYWILTCFTLAFILSYTYPQKIVKYLLLAVLFLITPYKLFFSTSRMMMVANFVAGVYLTVGLYLVLKIEWRTKIAIVLFGIYFIGWAFFSYSDRNALLGIVNGVKILEIFKTYDTQIGETRQKSILEDKREFNKISLVPIYNPDPPLNVSRLGKNNLMDTKTVNTMDQKTETQELLKLQNQMDTLSQRENTYPLIPEMSVSDARLYNPDPPLNVSRLGKNNLMDTKTVNTMDQKTETQELLKLQNQMDTLSQRENTYPLIPEMSVSDARLYNPDPPLNVSRLGWLKEWLEDAPEAGVKGETVGRNLEGAYSNAVFRLFIWRDMLTELIREKPILGFHFGKPLRSISLEILRWGESEWSRDRWIAAHNSYLNIIYRAGIIGLFAILGVFVILFEMIKKSIRCRSLIGVLLCGIIINWLVAANFLQILELPYTAIPFWALFGLTYAYGSGLKPAKS